MLRKFVFAIALALVAGPAFAQSQAVNGTIEGTVADSSGGVLPGVTVTITNIDTGLERSVVSNAEGQYRGLLLPLGQYKVAAELQGFKKAEQTGINLRAGDTATINFNLSVGTVSETVTITAESPIAQPGKIDLGRTIGDAEIHNLPLPSRNPYNFAFLQANVTGYENNEFGVPRINANGSQMHTNYQLDGNTNTEKDRAGLRLLPISEVLVREVKVVTNGFAPEFGQTTGMVYNAITQSGTNKYAGSASYRFKRNSMSTAPFFLAAGARKPDTKADDVTAALGGPIARDKAFFFGAYEYVNRSLITGGQIISVKPPDAAALGITLPASGVIPANQSVPFAFGKVDYQVTPSTLVTGRYFFFQNLSLSNIGGGLTTTDRATDFHDKMGSAAIQAVTTIGASKLNEFRYQLAQRHQFRTIGTGVDGPAITVSGIAQFGGPRVGDGNSVGFDFTQKINQVIDNFTWVRGAHALKTGVDVQWVADDRVQGDNFQYTFPTIDSYLAARTGTNRFGYTTLQQTFGQLDISYASRFYGVFVQDDWQLSPRIKLLYGIRYDLFDVPEMRPYAQNIYNGSEFTIDKNNWGPRAGLAWSLDQSGRTVVRASVGRMFEPPLIDFYDNSILNNGDPLRYNVSVSGSAAGAPAFPASLASLPAGFALPRQSLNAVDPAFRTQEAWLSNVQVERAFGPNYSLSAGYVSSVGRKLPVLIDVNLLPTGATLADGRLVYSTTVSAQTRVNPIFDHVNVFQSIASSNYNAFTATLTRRMQKGFQAQATYTLARGTDNAPLTGTYVVGSGDDRVSDPTNLDRDKGVTPFNQTHTLAISTVFQPQVGGDGLGAYLANHNQLGIIIQANSGLPFNIRSNRDLNGDGVTNDRPLGIERNAGRLGKVLNVDLRYSRFIPIVATTKGELFVEAKNLFNRQNISGVNRVVTTDVAGNPLVDISDVTATGTLGLPFSGTAGYDQRIVQVGVKVTF
ncbi:MAG TPA: TonB-dependent receptor [Vicinamibacterales bacterium]|nr:TonB-dependent receptor [Vicinamibacterales bacterium]